MALTLIAGPLVSALALADAKAHLKVEHDEDDLVIQALIDAAVEHLDGRDGILGRAIVEQTWELRLNAFPPCIEVPLPPLISIDSIQYVDGAGDLTTLPPEAYEVVREGFKPALVAPVYGTCWPSPRADREAVRMVFTAGYATVSEDSPIELTGPVPAKLVTAMKFHVELLYGRNVKDAALLQKTMDQLTAPISLGGLG